MEVLPVSFPPVGPPFVQPYAPGSVRVNPKNLYKYRVYKNSGTKGTAGVTYLRHVKERNINGYVMERGVPTYKMKAPRGFTMNQLKEIKRTPLGGSIIRVVEVENTEDYPTFFNGNAGAPANPAANDMDNPMNIDPPNMDLARRRAPRNENQLPTPPPDNDVEMVDNFGGEQDPFGLLPDYNLAAQLTGSSNPTAQEAALGQLLGNENLIANHEDVTEEEQRQLERMLREVQDQIDNEANQQQRNNVVSEVQEQQVRGSILNNLPAVTSSIEEQGVRPVAAAAAVTRQVRQIRDVPTQVIGKRRQNSFDDNNAMSKKIRTFTEIIRKRRERTASFTDNTRPVKKYKTTTNDKRRRGSDDVGDVRPPKIARANDTQIKRRRGSDDVGDVRSPKIARVGKAPRMTADKAIAQQNSGLRVRRDSDEIPAARSTRSKVNRKKPKEEKEKK